MAFVWLWITLFIVGFYPIIDGRAQILAVLKAAWSRRAAKADSGVSSPTAVEVQREEKEEK